MQIKQIAYIRSDFVEKFGIPRQSNLADTRAEIHFLPEYQNADALREIEAYDYLWLIWEFSESIRDTWSTPVFGTFPLMIAMATGMTIHTIVQTMP